MSFTDWWVGWGVDWWVDCLVDWWVGDQKAKQALSGRTENKFEEMKSTAMGEIREQSREGRKARTL